MLRASHSGFPLIATLAIALTACSDDSGAPETGLDVTGVAPPAGGASSQAGASGLPGQDPLNPSPPVAVAPVGAGGNGVAPPQNPSGSAGMMQGGSGGAPGASASAGAAGLGGAGSPASAGAVGMAGAPGEGGAPAGAGGMETSNGGAASEGGTGGEMAAAAGAPAMAGAPGMAGSPNLPTPDTQAPIGFATLNGGTTGGQGGNVVKATSYDELRSLAGSSDRQIIMVEGRITNGSGGGIINVGSNTSIIGVGDSAFLDGVVIGIKGSKNIIIQNLKITLVGVNNPTSVNDGDTISISGSSKNIWIDHCELYSEDPFKQTNIDHYDGLIDIKNSSGFITVSWTYAHDHHKGFLVGSSDSDLDSDRKITYHHNYFNRVLKRTPTYRGAVGHVFNNYVTSADQATFAMAGTCLRVENNHYESAVKKKYSIFTNAESTGRAERIDNFIEGGNNRAFPADCTADIPYDYSGVLTPTADVKAVVMAGAGVGKL